ncbi:MAG: hypothetical protein M1457_07240 [bacterium]|nr:hypothetical protein [bacterium]
MEVIPKAPIYLVYGNQVEPILKMRDAILDAVMEKEGRNENLTEYYSTGVQDRVQLMALMDEIAGDLSTMSFIPEAGKCAVVTNPAEVFAPAAARGGRKGKDKEPASEDPMLAWIERELPATGHTMLLLAFEDEAAGREVNPNAPLFQLIQRIGWTRRFGDTKAFFRIEDAIVARNPAACVQAVRDLWGNGKGDTPVYNSVARCLRFLLEANIARERRTAADPAAQALYFPADPGRNLFKAHEAVRRKYLGRPVYRTGELLRAYEGLLDVYRAMRPRPDDVYVADARGLLEQILMRLLTSLPPRRG